jgi:membrane protein DedA with SNARE-associated domain
MIRHLLAIVFGTFVSEDLACIGAGLMVHLGRVPLLPAISACALGIWVGDLGLWLGGRAFGSRVLSWPKVYAVLPPSGVARFTAWFDRHAGVVIVGSRFTPGTRSPLYLAAGACRTSFAKFALWSFVAVVLWTPVLVGVSAWLGEQVAARVGVWIGVGTAISVTLTLLALSGWRWTLRAVSRRRLAQKD